MPITEVVSQPLALAQSVVGVLMRASQSLALTQSVKVKRKKNNERPKLFLTRSNQFDAFARPTLPRSVTDTESGSNTLTLSQTVSRALTLTRTVPQSVTLAQTAVSTRPSHNALTLSGAATCVFVPGQPSVITSLPVGNASGQQPNIVVRDITNGYDLYTRNANTVYNAPASTTKLMTLLLMWEYKNSVWASQTVTVTSADVTQPYAGITLSAAGLQANDVLTWEDLAYCANLPSGFDACYCAARILGDALYAAAGNTGTQGVTRFVERMNARAVELGMTNATYFDPAGVSSSGGTDRNKISARDLNTILKTAYTISGLRTIGGTITRNATITGANARTLALAHSSRFINGPLLAQANIKDSNVLCAKTGEWQVGGPTINAFNQALIMSTPSGYEVAIATLGSETRFGMMLDVKGIMYALRRDFPYLYRGDSDGTDASFSSVKLLIGADGSIVDESSNARTVTTSTVTVGSAIIEGTGSIAVSSNTNSDVHVADAGDLTIGSGDWTAECWYTGTGLCPNDGVEFLFAAKFGGGGTQREFAFNLFNGAFNIFISSDGSNWTHADAYDINTADKNTIFNGAPRHIACVKHGSEWSMYLCGEKLTNTVTLSTPFDGNAPLYPVFPGSAPVGNIDDFRATYGVARYTAGMVTLNPRKFPRS